MKMLFLSTISVVTHDQAVNELFSYKDIIFKRGIFRIT